jgi:hypothetical protein
MDQTLCCKLVESPTAIRLDDENVLLDANLHLLNERALATSLQTRSISDADAALQAANLKRNCDRQSISSSSICWRRKYWSAAARSRSKRSG